MDDARAKRMATELLNCPVGVCDHRGSNSQVVDFERVEIYPAFTEKI
jgi:hypothetical protein